VVALGIILTVYGFKSTDSLISRVSRLFNGGETDRTMRLLAGGILRVMVGLSLGALPPFRVKSRPFCMVPPTGFEPVSRT
jgi:hypothetical protein